jgi:hypothetical protein
MTPWRCHSCLLVSSVVVCQRYYSLHLIAFHKHSRRVHLHSGSEASQVSRDTKVVYPRDSTHFFVHFSYAVFSRTVRIVTAGFCQVFPVPSHTTPNLSIDNRQQRRAGYPLLCIPPRSSLLNHRYDGTCCTSTPRFAGRRRKLWKFSRWVMTSRQKAEIWKQKTAKGKKEKVTHKVLFNSCLHPPGGE